MPEHRPGTPQRLRLLESFLWHDFDRGLADWALWLDRKLPPFADDAGTCFGDAIALHAALRCLQDVQSGHGVRDAGNARRRFNAIVAHHGVRPVLAADGTLAFDAGHAYAPVANVLLAALEAQRSGLWHRFRRCRDPGCRASFYDASRPGTQVWCEMRTCGSRDKMRRLRARAAHPGT